MAAASLRKGNKDKKPLDVVFWFMMYLLSHLPCESRICVFGYSSPLRMLACPGLRKGDRQTNSRDPQGVRRQVMYIIRRDIRDPNVRHYITTGHIVASVVGSIAFVAMICAGTFFIRRHVQRKKKRAALNEEAMQSDSSSEMPAIKDHEHSPMRSIEPEPMAWCDGDGSLRDPSHRQLEILQGAADTIVNVKATDLRTSSSLGNLRELEAASRLDGPVELPTTAIDSQELDATSVRTVNQRAELPGNRSELETGILRYDERPPRSSHSHYRDVFVDAPERMTPRNSTDGGKRRPQPAELGAT